MIQLSNLVGHFRDVVSVVFHVGLGGANVDVEIHSDMGVGEPAGGVVGRKTNGMVTCFMRGKCKSPFCRSSRSCNAVSRLYFLLYAKVSRDTINILGTHLDIHLNAQRVMRRVFVLFVVPFERSVMTYASVSQEQI